MNGVVKFYHYDLGYGFLQCPDLPEDVFVGAKAVALPPGEGLRKGQAVTFDLGRDRDGRPRAENVKLAGQDPDATAEEGRPYVQYGRGRRQYLRADLNAEEIGSMRSRARAEAEELWPAAESTADQAALRFRGSVRHQYNARSWRDERRRNAQKLWTHHGEDEAE